MKIGILTDEAQAKHCSAVLTALGVEAQLLEHDAVAANSLDGVITDSAHLGSTWHTSRPVLLLPPFPSSVVMAGLRTDAETQGTVLHPALPLRTLPPMQMLYETLAGGQLGRLISGRLEYHVRDASRSPRDLLTHALDVLHWLSGDHPAGAHIEQATAHWLVSLRLGDAHALLDIGHMLPPGYPLPEALTLELYGTGGFARVNAFQQYLMVMDRGMRWDAWTNDSQHYMIEAFIAHLRDGAPLATIDDWLRGQRWAEELS